MTQFNTVACRECTHPREDTTSQLKGWIQGNAKFGLVLEVTTRDLHGKQGIEIRIWSVGSRQFSLGSEFLMDQTNLWFEPTTTQKFLKDQFEEYAWKLDANPRQKQNHKEENLLALHQESFPWTEGIGHYLSEYEYEVFEESDSSSS